MPKLFKPVRKPGKKKTKDGQENEAIRRRYRAVSVTPRLFLWLALWIAALIFTQALRSPASNIFFGFVTVFPIASLIYTLISRASLKIYMLSESAVTEKMRPYTYEFRLINESILPYPFIDAYLRLPQRNSVRCTERCVKLSMAPTSTYTVKNEICFRFRGTYEIGVSCFYVYDFFRMFRVRVDADYFDTVYVLPRKLVINAEEAQAVSDSVNRTRRSQNTYDKLEVSDVREYRMGDSLKSIHWNLSSKTEDLIVRDYNTGTTEVTCIYCDMSKHFPDEAPVRPFVDPYAAKRAAAGETETPRDEDGYTPADAAAAQQSTATDDPAVREISDEQIAAKNAARGRIARRAARAAAAAEKKKNRAAKKNGDTGIDIPGAAGTKTQTVDISELVNDEAYEDMNEYCADGVVELTIAVVLREIRAGREVNLMWFDKRSEIGAFAFELRTTEDFDMIFRLFATAPLAPADETVSRLSAMVSDSQDCKQLFVIPAVDDETVATLCTMPCSTEGAAYGGTEVVSYAAAERYAHQSERQTYIEGCRAQLAEHGIKLIDGKLDESRVIAVSDLSDGKDEDGNDNRNTLGFDPRRVRSGRAV